jgi:endonuclease YncB( thermonuclease family)
MRYLIAIAFILTAVALATAADPKAPLFAVPCDVVSVHDGDTLHVNVHLGFGVDLPDRTIRAFGFDAWEVTKTRHSAATESQPITDEEIAKGKAARDELAELLKQGQLFIEDSGERDPYGRTSAVLWVRMPNRGWLFVAAWMESHNHLRVPRNSGK